jgi:hypothetical protein
MSEILPFKPRRPPSADFYYDPITRALQDLPPSDRISAIAAACDDDDLKKLAQLAAYFLGFAVLDEIKKTFEQAFADQVKEPAGQP